MRIVAIRQGLSERHRGHLPITRASPARPPRGAFPEPRWPRSPPSAAQADGLTPERLRRPLACSSLYWHGYDLEGRPILWVRPIRKNWDDFNVEEEKLMHVLMIEYGVRQVRAPHHPCLRACVTPSTPCGLRGATVQRCGAGSGGWRSSKQTGLRNPRGMAGGARLQCAAYLMARWRLDTELMRA